ncbi:MAG: serine hydrolase domain-containing protein [Thermodesulfobacteriota bacterium]
MIAKAGKKALVPIRKAGSRMLVSVSIPEDLSSVLSYDPAEEEDPKAAGMTAEGKNAIWEAVEGLFRSGMHPAVSFCLRRNGRVVLKRALGYAKGGGPTDAPDAKKVPATPETPICLFSASKAISAMCIHLLVEKKLLNLNDPVDAYVPEFSAHGKQDTTVFHVLSHLSGFPGVPAGTDPETLYDFDACAKMLCDARPVSEKGRVVAYHAITGGFILGEIVKRITGKDIRTFLGKHVQKPLGFRYFNYGVPKKDAKNVADNYYTGVPVVFPISAYIKHALSASWADVVRISNDSRYFSAIIPAGNAYSTADEACRFFECLLNDGELNGVRVFSPLTVRRATIEARPQAIDRTLFLPMRYSPGFMLGNNPVGLFGPFTRECFGHWGFINSFCWADRRRNVSVALLNTGKPLLGPHIPAHAKLLYAIARHCPSDPGKGEPRKGYNRALGDAFNL